MVNEVFFLFIRNYQYTNIAIELFFDKLAIEIVDLPINNGVFSIVYASLPAGRPGTGPGPHGCIARLRVGFGAKLRGEGGTGQRLDQWILVTFGMGISPFNSLT